jgi:hypothetical protein
MSQSKEKDLHLRDLRFVIEEVIDRLDFGETRFIASDYQTTYSCLKDFSGPQVTKSLDFEKFLPVGNEEAKKQFYEEIRTIEQVMIEENVPIELDDWQKNSGSESDEKLFKEENRRAYAIQIWNWYAIPWRIIGNQVYVIYSPYDIKGAPNIRNYPTEYFLQAIANNMVNRQKIEDRLNKKISFWKRFGVIILILVGLIMKDFILGLIG